ncbi:hypothetical protein OIV83_005222 [Microbotryomycetes sp. JL201]|nr:hypothetical protein OIV83_005222 [Microbotryomycetes sp. JL201]
MAPASKRAKTASSSKMASKVSASPPPSKKRKTVTKSEDDVDLPGDDGSSDSEDDDDDDEDAYSETKSEEDASPTPSTTAASEDEAEDEDDTDSAIDNDDTKGSSSKQRKPKGTKSKSSRDDRNIRVVKKITKIPGPKEDPNTAVILPTTLHFLKDLVKHNDRDWFQENDARYRHALANFTAFIQAWVPKATEADWSLPHLPAKELMQRIYRDVRFSKDKTPYKTWMSASHSRTGRKGPFALYYLEVGAKGRSLLAGGLWCPPADQTRMFRNAVLRDPAPIRRILNDKTFVKYFGKPDPKAGRTSVYGHRDELKNSPKIEGVTKEHKDIDLLKLRSVAVDHYFTDEQVLSPTFLDDHVVPCMKALAPFVQLLNDILHPSDDSDEGGADSGDDSGNGQEQDGADSAEGEEDDGGEESD